MVMIHKFVLDLEHFPNICLPNISMQMPYRHLQLNSYKQNSQFPNTFLFAQFFLSKQYYYPLILSSQKPKGYYFLSHHVLHFAHTIHQQVLLILLFKYTSQLSVLHLSLNKIIAIATEDIILLLLLLFCFGPLIVFMLQSYFKTKNQLISVTPSITSPDSMIKFQHTFAELPHVAPLDTQNSG